MVITSCPLPQNEAERLNTLVSLQPEFTPLDGQFSAGANTLKQIGDHLGHRSANATLNYTKVDLTGLREVAEFDLGWLL